MDTASPPVYPKVDAKIFMTQKIKVTSGTLLKVFSSVGHKNPLFISCFDRNYITRILRDDAC
jgi:hypothetical protein